MLIKRAHDSQRSWNPLAASQELTWSVISESKRSEEEEKSYRDVYHRIKSRLLNDFCLLAWNATLICA